MSKSVKPEFPESVDGKVTARVESVRKFRQGNPRIDYYPLQNAMAAIEWLRERYPKLSTREVIDALAVKGKESFSGNTQR